MDLETQGSEQSELDLISAIGVDEPETETTQEAPAQPQEPVQEPEEPTEPDPSEEIARLQRIIATDPAKRAAYEAEKYGVAYQPPVVQPPAPQPEQKQLSLEEEFAQKFPGEDYDPFNIRHSAFVQEFNLRPAFGYIDQQKKEEEEFRQRQAQEENAKAVENLNKGVQDLFTKHLPVVADILKADSLDYKQEILLNQMETQFQKVLVQRFPQRADGSHLRLWASPEVHKEIVREVMPTIKQLASDLGLSQPIKKTVDQKVVQETYVESSNAVPTTQINPFDEALKKGDVASALGAFSNKYK